MRLSFFQENEKILNVKGRFVGYTDFGKETVNVLGFVCRRMLDVGLKYTIKNEGIIMFIMLCNLMYG